ncbi:hypothetical protein FGO68_gene3125 [Halteria grandinella]|uniref:Homeobox domain-containing protein n=1 Tax=Halteria grandinella TaxID=5974 RepID=A0A8J8NPJ8_HALGN|nr:hypothetical protein FGO68_gene3125 [Halteria grandinella]
MNISQNRIKNQQPLIESPNASSQKLSINKDDFNREDFNIGRPVTSASKSTYQKGKSSLGYRELRVSQQSHQSIKSVLAISSQDSDSQAFNNRARKKENQIKYLMNEFHKFQGPWTKEQIAQYSRQTGLTESQVYKWNWDQRKKIQSQIQSQGRLGNLVNSLSQESQGKRTRQEDSKDVGKVKRDEFGGYCCKRIKTLDKSQNAKDESSDAEDPKDCFEESLCKLLGIDVESKAHEIALQTYQELRSKQQECYQSQSFFNSTTASLDKNNLNCDQNQAIQNNQSPTKRRTTIDVGGLNQPFEYWAFHTPEKIPSQQAYPGNSQKQDSVRNTFSDSKLNSVSLADIVINPFGQYGMIPPLGSNHLCGSNNTTQFRLNGDF